jgi:hypothetical protein
MLKPKSLELLLVADTVEEALTRLVPSIAG